MSHLTDNPGNNYFDIIIIGGGLAGLTLALQIKQRLADLSIAIFERSAFPAPLAAHKVGEATVELSSYYLGEIIGIRDHLETEHLPKLGLRYFFNTKQEPTQQLEDCLEFGTKSFPPTPSYQLDRGILENHLYEKCLEKGINVFTEHKVNDVTLGEHPESHQVSVIDIASENQLEYTAQWLVDASSRNAVIKRKQELAQPSNHSASSAWFRVEGKIDVDSWADSDEWQMHHQVDNARWFSTNHLMGEGYWMWLIPLSSGSTSIGIVADNRYHSLKSYNTLEKAMEWIQEHQPLCAEKIRPFLDRVQDFKAVKNFTLNSEQVYSVNRWFLTGEAGVFLDPFYSPGSDYIAISNTFITNIIQADVNGMDVRQMTRKLDRLYLKLFESTLCLYEDKYALFGNAPVMVIKYLWDTTLYWGLNCLLFIQDKFDDYKTLQRYYVNAAELSALNEKMQKLLLKWHEYPQRPSVPGYVNISCGKFDFFIDMNRILTKPLSQQAFEDEFLINTNKIRVLYSDIVEHIVSETPELAAEVEAMTVADGVRSPIANIMKLVHGDLPMDWQYENEMPAMEKSEMEGAMA